jgi:glycosyltransferase involved in cell wall biosynthesis
MSAPPSLRHVGLGLGRIRHWHDGLGEFSRQLLLALAARAAELREQHRVQLHAHLPRAFHGLFGPGIGYLDTATTQRWLHLARPSFVLWHTLHQHNRLRAPWGTRYRVETVHDLNFLHTKDAAKAERYRRRLQRRLERADTVIAITHHVADDIRARLPTLAAPLQVIHNGATDLTSAPQAAVEGVAVGPGAPPYLLHVSRLAPTKNIAALLDLAAAWPEQPLVLAGARSDYTDGVARSIAERGLRNVTLRLDVSEAQKAWLYAHCEGFVFPSFAEGFGLPPIEAMHFGKPVFLSRLTSLPEVGGAVAHYFDSFDGAAMRRVVEAGLASHAAPGRAEAVAAHAGGFSWAKCADAHIRTYLNLLATLPASG